MTKRRRTCSLNEGASTNRSFIRPISSDVLDKLPTRRDDLYTFEATSLSSMMPHIQGGLEAFSTVVFSHYPEFSVLRESEHRHLLILRLQIASNGLMGRTKKRLFRLQGKDSLCVSGRCTELKSYPLIRQLRPDCVHARRPPCIYVLSDLPTVRPLHIIDYPSQLPHSDAPYPPDTIQ